MSDLSERTTMVVGASRGLGRGVTTVFAGAGAPVIAVARDGAGLDELAGSDSTIRTEVADATDPAAAAALLDRHEPRVLVLVAGAVPTIGPFQDQTWEAFSVNWETDVRLTFVWLREALVRPLAPGSHVVVVSSGAALRGSPASGGYAGAKAMQRFLAAYAQDESRRAGLDLTITSVLPSMTPLGAIGRAGVRAYADRDGRREEEVVADLGEVLTPGAAGSAILELVTSDPASAAPAYVLTAAGLQAVP